MNKALIPLALLLVLLVGCGGVETREFDPGGYRDRYTGLLSTYIASVRSRAGELDPIVDLCNAVESRGNADPDSLTVGSDVFWVSLFSRGWNDPSVYFVRVYLLMEAGRLEQAANTLSFAVIPAGLSGMQSNRDVIAQVWDDLMEQFEYYDGIWREGVRYFDQGQFQKALERYDALLALNPSYVPALVSKAVTLAVMEERGHEGGSYDRATELMARARELNPFYEAAYQGNRVEELRGHIVAKVLEPTVEALRTSQSGGLDLANFAEGCILIGAEEYALYALCTDIGQKLSAGEPVDEQVRMMGEVLEDAGLELAWHVLREVMRKMTAD